MRLVLLVLVKLFLLWMFLVELCGCLGFNFLGFSLTPCWLLSPPGFSLLQALVSSRFRSLPSFSLLQVLVSSWLWFPPGFSLLQAFASSRFRSPPGFDLHQVLVSSRLQSPLGFSLLQALVSSWLRSPPGFSLLQASVSSKLWSPPGFGHLLTVENTDYRVKILMTAGMYAKKQQINLWLCKYFISWSPCTSLSDPSVLKSLQNKPLSFRRGCEFPSESSAPPVFIVIPDLFLGQCLPQWLRMVIGKLPVQIPLVPHYWPCFLKKKKKKNIAWIKVSGR